MDKEMSKNDKMPESDKTHDNIVLNIDEEKEHRFKAWKIILIVACIIVVIIAIVLGIHFGKSTLKSAESGVNSLIGTGTKAAEVAGVTYGAWTLGEFLMDGVTAVEAVTSGAETAPQAVSKASATVAKMGATAETKGAAAIADDGAGATAIEGGEAVSDLSTAATAAIDIA